MKYSVYYELGKPETAIQGYPRGTQEDNFVYDKSYYCFPTHSVSKRAPCLPRRNELIRGKRGMWKVVETIHSTSRDIGDELIHEVTVIVNAVENLHKDNYNDY